MDENYLLQILVVVSVNANQWRNQVRGEGGAPPPLGAFLGNFGEILWMRTTLFRELNYQILGIIDSLTILLGNIYLSLIHI